jgi:hypothetical protein
MLNSMYEAHLGYAADPEGRGVAYARIARQGHEERGRLVRMAFRVRRATGLADREVGYEAVATLVRFLTEREIRHVVLSLPDAELVADFQQHREVPAPLVLPYVRLGCALNRLSGCELKHSSEEELCSRARAEVAFHTAA